MPRITPLAEPPSAEYEDVLRLGEETGTPDARMIEVLGRGDIGTKWLAFWHVALNQGLLPLRVKELVRIRMSVLDECGYCSSIRSKPAMAQGLTEEVVTEMADLDNAPHLNDREKAALRFADRFRDNAIDSDEVFEELRRHFDDDEIVELGIVCGMLEGGGRFARSLQVMTWAEACATSPGLSALNAGVTDGAGTAR